MARRGAPRRAGGLVDVEHRAAEVEEGRARHPAERRLEAAVVRGDHKLLAVGLAHQVEHGLGRRVAGARRGDDAAAPPTELQRRGAGLALVPEFVQHRPRHGVAHVPPQHLLDARREVRLDADERVVHEGAVH